MLVPVVGLMQVGYQAMADRYTYLPQIGLTVAVAWGAKEALAPLPRGGRLCGVAAALLVPVLMACAWHQVFYWHDSLTLWGHAVDCMPFNATAHSNLAAALSHEKRGDEAIIHFTKALELRSDIPDIHYNFGLALVNCGRLEEGIVQYQQAIDLRPDYSAAHNSLGIALARCGRLDEAIAEFRKALKVNPDYTSARKNLEAVLGQKANTK